MKPGIEASTALAQGFAKHMARIAASKGAPDEAVTHLERAALALSHAASAGHVCLNLGELIGRLNDVGTSDEKTHRLGGEALLSELQAWRKQLFSSGLVSDPAKADQPLILDQQDRLYLKRYFDYEIRLAERLLLAHKARPHPPDLHFRDLFKALFQADSQQDEAWVDGPQLAVALAMNRGFTVISGGPGTGKTTSILQLIRCAKQINPDARICLAAPTGKAATRMIEALQNAAKRIAPALSLELPAESFTIHRLLGIRAGSERLTFHRGNPLPVDLLIVDEASMLDLALAVQLVEAVPDTASMVFIGDKDQLAAVEAGAVFSELSDNPVLSPACVKHLSLVTGFAESKILAAPVSETEGLCDHAVWLRKSYRFKDNAALGELVQWVNQGKADSVIDLLRSGEDSRLVWIEDDGPVLGPRSRQSLRVGLSPYMARLKANELRPEILFEELDRHKILCAERQGPRGVIAINDFVCEMMRRSSEGNRAIRELLLSRSGTGNWFSGQALMVLKNDYHLGRFNGDIGIVLANEEHRPVVMFPDAPDLDKALPLSRLMAYEPAFALTVHKAQGSEYEKVVLILPAKQSPVVNRALLYTAISRAKLGLSIIAGESVLREAINTPAPRQSGLRTRFAEMLKLKESKHNRDA